MISTERLEAVKRLKLEGLTDKKIAEQLGLTYHQVHYIKQLARLGRYANVED